MRSLMLALGTCLFALNFAGCAGTGSCSGGLSCNSGCSETLTDCGGANGLGLGLFEAGPECKSAGCDGGCSTCRSTPVRSLLDSRPKRERNGLFSRGCGEVDCGCDTAPVDGGCGCGDSIGAPAPAIESNFGDCGCTASADGCADGSCGVQNVSHAGDLMGFFGMGRHKVRPTVAQAGGCPDGKCGGGLLGKTRGCGRGGCGGPGGGLCGGCMAASRTIPHRQPPMNPTAAGQAPSYAYPYYSTRAPRDFLRDNPPTIGY